jgi:ligand-binding sensor domain-containing protein
VVSQNFSRGVVAGAAVLFSETFVHSGTNLWIQEEQDFSVFAEDVVGLQGRNGTVFYWTADSLFSVSDELFKTAVRLPENMNISGVLQSGTSLWVGERFGGLWFYDGQSWVNFTTRNGLGDNRIRKLEMDQNGDLWIVGDLNLTKVILNSAPTAIEILNERNYPKQKRENSVDVKGQANPLFLCKECSPINRLAF